MQSLLAFSRLVDRCSAWLGRNVAWLVLAAVLVSALNAIARKAFGLTSNAFLEVQWYLFATVFMLAAGYALLRQEHVRIDVVLGRFPKRTQIWVDIFGICVFLLPFVAVVTGMSWPIVLRAWQQGEVSSNVGGLIRWPVYALLPAGLLLLGLQGLSELVKRIAFLQGLIPDPTVKLQAKSAEEELAEFLQKQRGEAPVEPGDAAPVKEAGR